jgi:serine/threonine protein kinase
MTTSSSQKQTFLDLFKKGLISQEELETALKEADALESKTGGDTSPRPQEPRSLSGQTLTGRAGTGSGPGAGDVLAGMFQLQQPIGRGGMGVVWKADDLQGGRQVCVKLLPPEVQDDKTELARVRSMFQKVHALNHQFLCPLYLLGNDSQYREFLVMKYIDGQTLGDYRQELIDQRGAISLGDIVRLLGQVAEALDYVHAQGLIHRDVKPANIMVCRDGKSVQLVDLGLAAEIQSSMSRVSKASREMAGTAPYMAPEQWNGDPLNGHCDQYALAVVAYQMLAGRYPFEATSELAWMNCALNRVPQPVTEVGAELKPRLAALNDVLGRGLGKKAADRFATCVEFIQALKNAATGVAPTPQPVQASVAPPPTPVSTQPVADMSAAVVAPTAPAGSRSHSPAMPPAPPPTGTGKSSQVATVTIKRQFAFAAMLMKFNIYVDGQFESKISCGCTVALKVRPGEHLVEIRGYFFRMCKIVINATPGESIPLDLFLPGWTFWHIRESVRY